jgi:iron(III) transport system ATP-binding protein
MAFLHRVVPAPLAKEAEPDLRHFVRVSRVRKSFDGTPALRGVDFDVPLGKTVTLLGPSGCGKTTMLRSIAGLDTPDGGRITIGGEIVFDAARAIDLPSEKRQIGMVFQSYAVWPHMTVGQNVGFPLKVKRVPTAEIATRVRKVLDLVGLGGLAARPATNLSGGQQQRVALARAIVHEPRLVLFDEPLSNLDAKLRHQMRTELRMLQDRLGFTAIYVTHDQQEALALSDTVIVMNQGLVEAMASPRELFSRPPTPFTANFLGFDNMIEGAVALVRPGAHGPYAVEVSAGDLTITACWHDEMPPVAGMPVILAFRSDRVSLRRTEPGHAAPDGHRGIVEACIYLGTCQDYIVASGSLRVHVVGPGTADIQPGHSVEFKLAPDDCLVFRRDAIPFPPFRSPDRLGGDEAERETTS